MKKSLVGLAIVSALSLSSSVFANQAGDWLIRGGLTLVSPDSNKAAVMLDGADSGLKVSVDNNTQLGLNAVYFYQPNLAVEILAATPFTHDVKLHADETTTLAEVTHLPPTVSVLYYLSTDSAVKPYVGAGINYTVFFNEKFTKTYKEAGFSDLSLDSSFGYSLQVGVDYDIDKNWSVNASARYIDIQSDATFKVGGSVNGKASVDVNPMVYSVMIGYKF